HAHQRGILHRDLKPGNILIDAAGQPHITDFGLARRIQGDSHLTQSGAIVGTPSYMAPEQAQGKKGLTIAADVHSLGAILYELLTGVPPFRSDNPLDTLLQVIEQEPSRPRSLNPKVSRDLETIALKCLAKDPAQRYASASALAVDLNRWLEGKPIFARPLRLPVRLWRSSPGNPALALASTAALVTLVVALVLGYGIYQQSRVEMRLSLIRSAEAARKAGNRPQAIKLLKEAVAKGIWNEDLLLDEALQTISSP